MAKKREALRQQRSDVVFAHGDECAGDSVAAPKGTARRDCEDGQKAAERKAAVAAVGDGAVSAHTTRATAIPTHQGASDSHDDTLTLLRVWRAWFISMTDIEEAAHAVIVVNERETHSQHRKTEDSTQYSICFIVLSEQSRRRPISKHIRAINAVNLFLLFRPSASSVICAIRHYSASRARTVYSPSWPLSSSKCAIAVLKSGGSGSTG